MNALLPGSAIERAVGFAPTFASDAAGWHNLALYCWKGHVEECVIDLSSHPVLVLHVGGTKIVPVRVQNRWERERSQPGLITLVPPGPPVGMLIGGQIHSLTAHFTASSFPESKGFSLELMTEQLRFRCAFQDQLIASAITALADELVNPRCAGSLFADSIAESMALHLLRIGTPAPLQLDKPRGGLTTRQIRETFERIEASIELGISLNELADGVGLSRAHFARAFRESTGVAPHRYLIQRRVQRARELLEHTDQSIATIALRCGFASQAHFTEYFRRETNLTPHAFRRNS